VAGVRGALTLLLAALLANAALWLVEARTSDEAVVAASWGCRR